MKDNAERMKCVRQIVAKRKQQKEKRKESFFKVTSVMLACLLLYCISSFPRMYPKCSSGRTLRKHYPNRWDRWICAHSNFDLYRRNNHYGYLH